MWLKQARCENFKIKQTKMNFPRYKFAKETQPELQQFLKVVKEQKQLNSPNIDLNKYEIWSKLLPLDITMMQKLDETDGTDKITIIDLSSEEENTNRLLDSEGEISDNKTEFNENSDNSNIISDTAFAIKENFEKQHNLAESLKDILANGLVSEDLEELFGLLDETLNSEEVFYFGESIQDSISSILITLFCKFLLVPRIMKEYSESFSTLVQQYSVKHSLILKESFLLKLHDLHQEEVGICQQYINDLNPNFKALLLRDFIFSIHNLSENDLLITGTLINSQVEYEALNKLVEMLSNVAEDHSRDNAFGKLLMNTVQFLGPNLSLLEKPLKHIVAGHKSVWRSKLEKSFNICYEDSSMLTQSFRD